MTKRLSIVMVFVLLVMSGCSSNDEEIDLILADVPLPAGFDQAEINQLSTYDSLFDGRYQLIAETTKAVACGWLDQWFTALDEGDEEQIAEAADALDTSRQWAALVEIEYQGAWSEAV